MPGKLSFENQEHRMNKSPVVRNVARLDLEPEQDGMVWLDVVVDLDSLGVRLSLANARELRDALDCHLTRHSESIGTG